LKRRIKNFKQSFEIFLAKIIFKLGSILFDFWDILVVFPKHFWSHWLRPFLDLRRDRLITTGADVIKLV
jgi:hypothetical protein